MPTLVAITGTGGAETFGLGADRVGKPSRFVAVADLRLSDTHITRAEWRSIRTAATGYTLALGQGQAPASPITMVSWFDSAAWCNALSESDGLQPRYKLPGGATYTGGATSAVQLVAGSGYRLVTSAEWEYAARSGTRPGNEWAGANGGNTRVDVANVASAYPYTEGGAGEPDVIWGARGAPAILRVKQLAANGFGLFDMSGNVHEWTHTPWGGTEYDGDDSGHPWRSRQRIVRGGSATGHAPNLMPNERMPVERSGRMPNLGLRVALDGLS